MAAVWHEATITRIEPLTPRITSFFLRAPLAAPLAGQHLDVRLTAPDGYVAQRSYSIASAPDAPELELAIEKLDDGEVSSFFHEAAQLGDTIEVRGPLGGHFVWRPQDGGPLLLIAGGSGIAPLIAIARQRLKHAPGTPLLLLYSARTWEDLAYRDELLAGDDQARVVLITTRGPKQRDMDYTQRLDRVLLHDALAAWKQVPLHTFVCGSTPFVEAISTSLVREGVTASSIRTERYGGAG